MQIASQQQQQQQHQTVVRFCTTKHPRQDISDIYRGPVDIQATLYDVIDAKDFVSFAAKMVVAVSNAAREKDLDQSDGWADIPLDEAVRLILKAIKRRGLRRRRKRMMMMARRAITLNSIDCGDSGAAVAPTRRPSR